MWQFLYPARLWLWIVYTSYKNICFFMQTVRAVAQAASWCTDEIDERLLLHISYSPSRFVLYIILLHIFSDFNFNYCKGSSWAFEISVVWIIVSKCASPMFFQSDAYLYSQWESLVSFTEALPCPFSSLLFYFFLFHIRLTNVVVGLLLWYCFLLTWPLQEKNWGWLT